VARPELLDRMTADAAARLMLVVAPAGWGKSSLLREWCLGGEAPGPAWLSADRDDNDPPRFWSRVIAAVNSVSAGVGAAAREALTGPGGPAAVAVMDLLISDLGRMPGRVTLVIDDFHLITNPAIQECFAFLVEHLPPTLGLVVAARSDPSLPLARLRARGEMAEIRIDELRFSAAQAAELLNGTLGLALAPADVDVLQQRTEGWAAGLYLAGLSLRGHADPAGLIGTFAGDDRQIVDYFAAEVLDGQPDRVRSLLQRTSVLGRFCGPLADAVTGQGGSQGLLAEMERSPLFLVPLDTTRCWYRYHYLFAELLRHELDRSEPGLAPLLHRRASAWHRQHGTTSEAIEHAILAGDLADARELIAAHWNTLLTEGRAGAAESWLDRMPLPMVVQDARMCLFKGQLAGLLGRPDDVEPWLTAARAAEPQGPVSDGHACLDSAAAFVRTRHCHVIGDLAAAERASRQAIELEAAGTPQWQATALAGLGANLFWRGRHDEASDIFEQVTAPTRPPADSHAAAWALGCQAAISARRGDLRACERHLRKAASLTAGRHLDGHWITATALTQITTADLLVHRGELAQAEQAAQRGLELARRHQASLETAYALLCLARISTRTGQPDDARARLGEAEELIAACPDPGILPALLSETYAQAAKPPQVPRPRPPAHLRRPDGLTTREAQVLQLLAAGHTNHEIATHLVVSVHTIERHLQNAYRKIGVRNRADAAAHITRTDITDEHRAPGS
jgi:LuxR family maltose regulon positive regulatory protein